MLRKAPNIVQAEFFLVHIPDCPRLSHVLADIFERTADDMPSKVVVRFFDLDDSVSQFTAHLFALEQKHHADEKEFFKATGLRRRFLSKRLQWRLRRIVALQRRCTNVARAGLIRALGYKNTVAIEPRGCDFRYLRAEEEHDTIEAVTCAQRVWLFLFPYNGDLRADGILSIAHSL